MKLTITLSLEGGEAIPSSEIEHQGRSDVHSPKTPDTRLATLRHALEAAVTYVERRSAELSITAIKDPAAPFNSPEKSFGKVTVESYISEDD